MTRRDIETMPYQSFTDWICDLAIDGGPSIIAEFRRFLAIVGPCAQDIDKRWHALAILIYLHIRHGQMTTEIELLQPLFLERLNGSAGDETRRLPAVKREHAQR